MVRVSALRKIIGWALAASSLEAHASDVVSKKDLISVQINMLCNQGPSMPNVICSVGTGALLRMDVVVTAHHVVRPRLLGRQVVGMQLCLATETQCTESIPAADVRIATTGDQRLSEGDLAILKLPAPLVSRPSQESALGSFWRAHPGEVASPSFEGDSVELVGRTFRAKEPRNFSGQPLFQVQPLALASPSPLIDANLLVPYVWQVRAPSGVARQAFRTCDGNWSLQHGFSGGPVFRANGSFVGVVSAQIPAADTIAANLPAPSGACSYSSIIAPLSVSVAHLETARLTGDWPTSDGDAGPEPTDAPQWTGLLDSSVPDTNMNQERARSVVDVFPSGRLEPDAHRLPLVVALPEVRSEFETYLSLLVQREYRVRDDLAYRVECALGNAAACVAHAEVPPVPAPPSASTAAERSALAAVDSMRSIWDAERHVALVSATMRRVDEQFGLFPFDADLIAGPEDDHPPPLARNKPDCDVRSEDVEQGRFELLLAGQLGLTLDDTLASAFAPVSLDRTRKLFRKLERREPPASVQLQANLNREFMHANALIAERPAFWGWPKDARIELRELPFRCFARTPRLQRLTWAVIAQSGLLPFASLGLSGVAKIAPSEGAIDLQRLFDIGVANGVGERLLAEVPEARARLELEGLRANLVALGANRAARLLGNRDSLAVDNLLIAAYRAGLSQRDWNQLSQLLTNLRCRVANITSLAAGRDTDRCSE